MIHWGAGGGGALGFGSSDFWVDKWSLSARWVRGGKEGVSPEPRPVPGPSPVDSSSPSRGLHAYAALKAQDLWSREGSGGTLARIFCSSRLGLGMADLPVFFRKFLQDHSGPVFHAACGKDRVRSFLFLKPSSVLKKLGF